MSAEHAAAVWCDAHNPPGTPLTAATAHGERAECRNPHDVGPAVRAARHADAVARLLRDLDDARPGEGRDFLLEHLAEHGPAGLDVQELAARVTADPAEQS